MNGKGVLTNEENQTYFLKDIIEAVKSEKLDDDFCLYDKDRG
ncbi:conserved domain protein [Streptococcus constellatus subsp. pharyngis SK1060 = CCUG 46377]|uniref:Conserved domain protein n=1 Tax=Streptococcus constellatus subsp. pharyngis SK1060 = CCUG 46377 TaxID=1035184 RepID=F9P4W3_STRCV|nr:conserved domain protein [Streptococcus constellatus subsp. pharyngis SK1060 = CCUG 46377]